VEENSTKKRKRLLTKEVKHLFQKKTPLWDVISSTCSPEKGRKVRGKDVPVYATTTYMG
jgi:hypothetical protein